MFSQTVWVTKTITESTVFIYFIENYDEQLFMRFALNRITRVF
jgi:hypothetical protein